jgi:hypothetical protein
MGTMIGINSMILLASVWFIISKLQIKKMYEKWIVNGYRILNLFLFLFLSTFVFAGIRRSKWMYNNEGESFAQMQLSLKGIYVYMIGTGMGVFLGLMLIIIPAILILLNYTKKSVLKKP